MQNSQTLSNPLPKTFLKFALYFLRDYKWQVTILILLASLSGIYGTLNAYLTKILIDTIEATSNKEVLIRTSLWPAG